MSSGVYEIYLKLHGRVGLLDIMINTNVHRLLNMVQIRKNTQRNSLSLVEELPGVPVLVMYIFRHYQRCLTHARHIPQRYLSVQ